MGFDLSRTADAKARKQREPAFGRANEAMHAAVPRDAQAESAGVTPCRMHASNSHCGAPRRRKIQR
jgi:hypothetical protein